MVFRHSSNFGGNSRYIEPQAAPTEKEPTPVTSSSNFEGKSRFIEPQAATTEKETTPVTSSSNFEGKSRFIILLHWLDLSSKMKTNLA